MDIPPEVEIRSSIRQGSVYYFRHESLSSPAPHYFIVINHHPAQDTIILLVCASSQVSKRLMWYSACPAETLVLVKPEDYPEFSVLTVIDCNNVFEVTFEQLIKKREQGRFVAVEVAVRHENSSSDQKRRNSQPHSGTTNKSVGRLVGGPDRASTLKSVIAYPVSALIPDWQLPSPSSRRAV